MDPFYDIPEESWLFRPGATQRVSADRRWTAAEERVRQWCLHELIRSYGVSVLNLEIERQIRVARERVPHRADILVLHDGKPYVVVECKSRRVKNLDAAMKQAINYATLPDIRAPFAACTNGHTWLVRQKVGEEWAAVTDIPDFRSDRPRTEWRLILMTVNSLSPVLHWLDRPVPAKSAAKYFAALQRLFYARNEITLATNHDLLWATDNLLRVLSRVSDHEGFTGGKMAETCKALNKFWAERGMKVTFGGGDLWTMAHYAYAELLEYVEDERQPATIDAAATRLILALLSFLNGLKSDRHIRYSDVTEAVQREVRGYVNMSLIVRFNAELPDTLDKTSVEDIRNFCKSAWDHFLERKVSSINNE